MENQTCFHVELRVCVCRADCQLRCGGRMHQLTRNNGCIFDQVVLQYGAIFHPQAQPGLDRPSAPSPHLTLCPPGSTCQPNVRQPKPKHAPESLTVSLCLSETLCKLLQATTLPPDPHIDCYPLSSCSRAVGTSPSTRHPELYTSLPTPHSTHSFLNPLSARFNRPHEHRSDRPTPFRDCPAAREPPLSRFTVVYK